MSSLNWWKHNLIVYSPVWLIPLVFLLLGSQPEVVGEYMGSTTLMLIMMSIIFKLSSRGKVSEKRAKINYCVSVVVGVVLVAVGTNSFDLLVAILAAISLYLSAFWKKS